MKKMKREIEPIVFRSLRTPGLEGQRKRRSVCVCVCVIVCYCVRENVFGESERQRVRSEIKKNRKSEHGGGGV